MTNLSCKEVKTRKDHRCWGCRGLIPKGSRVLTVVTADGGTITTARWCSICNAILGQYQREMDFYGDGMPYGIIADEYAEEFAEASKTL